MKKLYFICNLHSGKAALSGSLAIIIDLFTANGYEVTVHPGSAELCEKRRAFDSLRIINGDCGKYAPVELVASGACVPVFCGRLHPPR